jgi:hypothetical protein
VKIAGKKGRKSRKIVRKFSGEQRNKKEGHFTTKGK